MQQNCRLYYWITYQVNQGNRKKAELRTKFQVANNPRQLNVNNQSWKMQSTQMFFTCSGHAKRRQEEHLVLDCLRTSQKWQRPLDAGSVQVSAAWWIDASQLIKPPALMRFLTASWISEFHLLVMCGLIKAFPSSIMNNRLLVFFPWFQLGWDEIQHT